jgi:polysaccharide export outer membrane protein
LEKSSRGRTIGALSSAAVFWSALVMAGCTALPAQGPKATDVVNPKSSMPSQRHEGYMVVDLDARVGRILKAQPDNSLQARFGDNRGGGRNVIGIGDTVSVTIWESASGGLFSAPVVDNASPGSHSATIPDQVVDVDASVTVPYAGRIKVGGLTTAQVEQHIVKALSGMAIQPQALVTVTKNISRTVTVSGDGIAGARVPMTPRGDRILDVLAVAGGAKSPAYETFIMLSRGGRSVTVPMQLLIDNPSENILVRPDDTITLVHSPQSFTAFGATVQNAVVPFDAKGITLAEAVAKAGGLLDSRADPAGVFLLRQEPVEVARTLSPTFPLPPGATTVNVVYRINLREPNTYFLAQNFRVKNKDLIYVAAAPADEWQKFLAIFGNTLVTAEVTRASVN